MWDEIRRGVFGFRIRIYYLGRVDRFFIDSIKNHHDSFPGKPVTCGYECPTQHREDGDCTQDRPTLSIEQRSFRSKYLRGKQVCLEGLTKLNVPAVTGK